MWSMRFLTCVVAFCCCLSFIYCEKYRICVVDGKGGFKKSSHYCPALDSADSKVECVVALDRLDCLRRISKGTVDFSVFSAEDLVTATNSQIEILITNELRYTKDKYEYEVVAVVNNEAGIKSRHNLGDKKYCHPGYGYETDWTRILANYFEASVAPPLCNPKLTITENRIKATSDFFKASCKAGPWVNNPEDDDKLKKKYSNLCSLCDSPGACSMRDKYWGRRGPLFCLTDGAGDISWARLDDVKIHFGLTPGGFESSPEDYSLLCPDDTMMPVNSSNPCVWVVKPWPVVAAKRTSAQEIQDLVSSLAYNDPTPWKSSLFNLIETSHLTLEKLEPMEPIESYLVRATGFLSANSFSGCHPPRTIHICTTSIIENAKCAWLRESANVYGIEPDLECLKADNTTHCMMALNENAADLVMVPNDLVHSAKHNYNLTTLFYETVNNDEKYLTVAVTKTASKVTSLEELRGRKACFPVYDGVAWNTVLHTFYGKKILSKCPVNQALADFFGPSCVPELPSTEAGTLKEICEGDVNYGDLGAIHCLTSGQGDVAFISKNSLNKFIQDQKDMGRHRYKPEDFKVICAEPDTSTCHLSWAPLAYGMVRSNSSDFWLKDTLDVFLQLDGLFGKNYQSLTTPFTMFGKYDGQSDLLFHDATVKLRNVPTAKNTDTMKRSFEDMLKNDVICTGGSTKAGFLASFLVLPVLVFLKGYL